MTMSGKLRKGSRRLLDRAGGCVGRYLFDFAGPAHRAIWIVGDGRSGTTWLANVLNADGRARILFEPYHPSHVVEAGRLGQVVYARPSEPFPALERFYSGVFAGHLTGKWVDRYNTRWVYRRRVVKDILGNLFLKWAVMRFPRVRKVLIVRHPFAVAVSKEAWREWLWFDDPAALLACPELETDFLAPYEESIRSAVSFFERQVVIWCVFHRVVFSQLRAGDVYVVGYEDLVLDAKQELNGLLGYLREPGLDSTPVERLEAKMREESPTSYSKAGGADPMVRLRTWENRLTREQIDRGLSILRAFGLDVLYSAQPLPHRKVASMIGRQAD